MTLLKATYDELIGGKLNDQLLKLRRFPEKTPRAIAKYPMAWALDYVSRSLGDDEIIDLKDYFVFKAISWLRLFNQVNNFWSHHPRYRMVAQTFHSSFLHSAPQLLVAAYLHQMGAKVGISLESDFGEPTPDLYVRQTRFERLSIEVKGPRALQWPVEGSIQQDDIIRAVSSALEKSRHQINSRRRGILAVVSSITHPQFPDLLESAIRAVVSTDGKRKPGVAGIFAVCPRLPIFQSAGDYSRMDVPHEVRVAANPYFEGDNPIAEPY